MASKMPAEILNEAADLIEAGWCQDAYREDGKFCSMGAINYVSWKNVEFEPHDTYVVNTWSRNRAVEILAGQIAPMTTDDTKSKFFDKSSWVIVWNDETDQTKEEVVHNFRIAAKTAEEGYR